MKELEGEFSLPKNEIRAETNQRQEYKLIGSINIKPGCKLYSFSFETLKVEEVKVKREAVIVGQDMREGTMTKQNKAIFDPRAIYIQAINMKNATRKVNRILNLHLAAIAANKPEVLASVIQDKEPEGCINYQEPEEELLDTEDEQGEEYSYPYDKVEPGYLK